MAARPKRYRPGIGYALYRMYDIDGLLLYVGLTTNPPVRFQMHVSKNWWPLVVTIKLEWFETLPELEVAEVLAITSESPRFNMKHNSPDPPKWRGRWR